MAIRKSLLALNFALWTGIVGAGDIGFAFDRSVCRIPEKFKGHPLFSKPLVGMNFGFMAKRGWYRQHLDEPAKMKAAGVNLCILKVQPCMEAPFSRKVFFDPVYSQGEDEVAAMIEKLHENGIMVILQPSITCLDGSPMAQVQMPDGGCQIVGRQANYWQEFFDSYTEALVAYADLCERCKVEGYIIGCEMARTERRDAEWRKAIRAVREHYSGPVSYEKIEWGFCPWMDDLDFLSTSWYPPAAPTPDGMNWRTNDPKTEDPAAWGALPSVGRDEMVAYLKEYAVPKLEELHRKSGGMPIFQSEVGMTCVHGLCRWAWAGAQPFFAGARIDQQEQADYMQAIHEAFAEQLPYYMGFGWWKWEEIQPRWFRNLEDPTKDGGFTIQGKPAEAVFRRISAAAAH